MAASTGDDAARHRAVRGSRTTPWPVLVLVVATVCTGIKLWIAASTYGTDDVRYWTGFLQGVVDHGPIGIYGVTTFEAPYNHPPLAGWMLLGFSRLTEAGVSFPFLIRVPASLADIACAVLVFRLLRLRQSERLAGISALVFAVSPLLFVISGFHGNTDPVFVMLGLLAGYAILGSGRGLLAGVAIGLALSVKLTPVVMLPVLLVLAVRAGRQVWTRFLVGGGVVFLVLWVPALVLRGPEFRTQVLGYSGAGPRQWGFSEIARVLGVDDDTIYAGGNALRFLVVVVAALLPAVLAMSPRVDRVAVLGLPLCLFLFLTPSFGYQYLTWALAPAFLLAPLLPAALYSLGSGLSAILVYSEWNGAPPWDWYEARSTPTPTAYLPVLALTWLLLGLVCLSTLRLLPRRPGAARTAPVIARTRSPEEPTDVRN